MENETLSFCNDADWRLLAHETSHQWFGDGITCKTWNDCWLNEGFATYVTDLFGRRQFGQSYLDNDISNLSTYIKTVPDGAVHPTDSILESYTDDYFRGKRVLDGRLTYAKGGVFLHMLNYLLGSDTAFYRCIREYITSPLRYGVATAEDLRASVERSSGMDLKWFFDEWIYSEGFPIYSIVWSQQDSITTATVYQQSTSEKTPFFTMPIQLEFSGAGLDTTIQLLNDQSPQTLSLIHI